MRNLIAQVHLLEEGEVRCMTIVQDTARCFVVNNLTPVERKLQNAR